MNPYFNKKGIVKKHTVCNTKQQGSNKVILDNDVFV